MKTFERVEKMGLGQLVLANGNSNGLPREGHQRTVPVSRESIGGTFFPEIPYGSKVIGGMTHHFTDGKERFEILYQRPGSDGIQTATYMRP